MARGLVLAVMFLVAGSVFGSGWTAFAYVAGFVVGSRLAREDDPAPLPLGLLVLVGTVVGLVAVDLHFPAPCWRHVAACVLGVVGGGVSMPRRG